ncbi:glycosyltransferase family 4 protein [Congregibacter sp.]|uniref:glycosyltransferase family 4 protein n=1 Tax=Congregibacter sp. TaxID=2744308 RepID=UPI003F6D6500
MDDIQIILGNSNKRFSGVTSTMLQVLEKQQTMASTAVLGRQHLHEGTTALGFVEMLRLCRKPLPDGCYRVFHARRNDEMIQALCARALGAKVKIAFTSTAQRQHSRFSRWLMSKMDGVISTNTTAASYLSSPPAIIVPHGVDTKRYRPPPDRGEAWRALGLPGDYGIGMFGRVRQSKGTDLLVDAALELLPRHPRATVVICGDCRPPDREFRQKLLEKTDHAGLSGRIRFIGEQPFNQLPALYRGMSIVAALSRHEGFGLTPVEAMASGCAVLTSRAGAWPDIVEDGVTGFTTPTGDLNAVKIALAELLHDSERTERMGEAGRRLVEARYTVEREARELTDYLLGLAASP